MHRVALLGLLAATACASTDLSTGNRRPATEFDGTGFPKYLADTHSFAGNPNRPESDALNVMRVEAIATSVEPLATETGTIWPGPPQPIRSLRDLQMETNPSIAPEPRMPTSRQLGEDTPGAAYTPAPKAPPSSPRSSTPTTSTSATVVTNADGTRTIIHPGGRVEFKPAPK